MISTPTKPGNKLKKKTVVKLGGLGGKAPGKNGSLKKKTLKIASIAKKAKTPLTLKEALKRPNFSDSSKEFARLNFSLKPGNKQISFSHNLNDHNLAMPHRMSFEDIKNSIAKFNNGTETKIDFMRWTDRFIKVGEEKIKSIGKSILGNMANELQQDFVKARDSFASDPKNLEKLKAFAKEANQFFANVPDLGQHMGSNNPVSSRTHLNFEKNGKERSLTPMSRMLVRDMSPGRNRGVAVTVGGDYIATDGSAVKKENISPFSRKVLKERATSPVKAYDPAKFKA